MSICVIIDPPKEMRPEGAIRCDVAWKLFLPEFMGDMPDLDHMRLLSKFSNWLWSELGDRLGYLKPEKDEKVWLLTPELTEAARSFIIRTCSFWHDELYVYEKINGKHDLDAQVENSWKVPVANLLSADSDDAALKRFTGEDDEGYVKFITPLLGETKTFMRVYEIRPGGTYARMHSHTAREESYLVLRGKGKVRFGAATVDIREGDIISKPLGPDVPSQLLADASESLRILDIEVWPDSTKRSKDVVHYPDHKELDLFGPGWNFMIPDSDIFPFKDAMENYSRGYERKADGTWEPKDVPGFKRRDK